MANPPHLAPLFKQLEDELGFKLDTALKVKVTQDVAATIDNIRKDDGLKHEFETHEQAVIDAGVKQYTRELVQGKKFGPEDLRLTALFTVEPVSPWLPDEAPTASAPSKPVPLPPPTARLSHLLKDPEYMEIFIEELQKAQSPGAQGHKAAMLFEGQLGNTDKVLSLMTRLELMEDTSRKKTPARYAATTDGLDTFIKAVRDHGMGRNLTSMVEEEKPRKERRGAISRRIFIGGGVSALAAGTTLWLHGNADEKVKEATGVVTPQPQGQPKEIKVGPGGFFENTEDPAAKIEERPAQEKIAQAKQSESGMMTAGIVSGAAALYTVRQVIRRVWRGDKDDFRKHARAVLNSLDPVVEAATVRVAQQEATRNPTN